MAEVDVVTAQIASGTSLSAEIDIGTKSLVGLLVPVNWTTAGLSFQISPDGGATWGELTTVAGTPYAIGSVTGGTLAYYVAIDPTTLVGAMALKVRSGTQASPVNQANTVTLQLVTRLVF
jgi:hypothetical protein